VAFRLLSILITVVLMGLSATMLQSHLKSSGVTDSKTPTMLLQNAATAIDQTHQATGTYALGVSDENAALKIVSADASGYCLQLTWIAGKLYHLRGPGGRAAPGAC
jgi:hypothetical protein